MYQILVVDDERIERNGIKMLLRHMQLPCEIAEAANGRDALEYLKEHTADILLTDVKMPFMDGIQLIEECKKDDRNEDMKCVIFSGCSEFDYARKAVRLGVSDYILKPVDPSEFKETITRVIQELEAERAEKNMKKKSMQQMREHALYQIVNGVNVAEVLEKSGGVLTKSDVDCFCRILMLETDDELMENKFYHPNVRLFYSGMKSSDCEIIKIDDDTLIKQMKQDIRMKDVQSLRDHFERFSQKYRSQTAFSQMYIKFLFANLLKDIYDAVPGEGEKQLNTKIDQLYRSFDFVQVTDIVSDSINLLEKTFSGRVQTGHREVEAVKRYIAAHYGDEMSVERLSELVYMAPSYLSSVFKKETGQNLNRFIKSVRMEKAKDLLEQTMMKIVDISTACGYPNVSYFCSSFREYYGISPQKFRESGDEMIEEK